MSMSLRLTAAALVALGGAPPTHAAPLSEWLGATVSSSIGASAFSSGGAFPHASDAMTNQALLPGQTQALIDGQSFDIPATEGGTSLQGQVDWNLSTSLQVTDGSVGFERATMGLGVTVTQQWLELAANGQALPLLALIQGAGSNVVAQFRLDAVTDARMFGSTGAQKVAAASVGAELMFWDEALSAWQALATPVPTLTLGQSFEWASRLDPGLYQWQPTLGFNQTALNAFDLAFASSFDLTLELSEVAAPPPATDVPEPGSLALAASGLAALRWRGVAWRAQRRTGRSRSNTQ